MKRKIEEKERKKNVRNNNKKKKMMTIRRERLSHPSAFERVALTPLKRNSTVVRASADVFPGYVGTNCVGIEVSVARRRRWSGATGGRTAAGFIPVLSDRTHPFLDGDLSALPHELAHRYDACDSHSAHQHDEHAADVRQTELVRRRATLQIVVLRNKKKD